MAKLKTALTLALLLTGSMFAADVSGKWSGVVIAKTPSGETNTESAWMSLKQSGDLVTGTAGPNAEQQADIKEGRTDGSQVQFKVVVGEATANVRLKLDGESLKGEAVVDTPDGPVKASLDLKRVP